ncbi:MAG: hypothetical protein WD669_12335 [Pirellulales bacterium]
MAHRKSPRKSSTKRRTSAKSPARSAKTAPRSTAAAKAGSKKRRISRPSGNAAASAAGDREVTIDRRRGAAPVPADATRPLAQSPTAAPKLERRKKVNRRRQIDPTTCERDYTDDEVEFMNAIDEYKHTSGRMFPTCSEVLEVLRGLGYLKMSAPQQAALQESRPSTPSSAEATIWSIESAAEMTL